MAQAVRVRTKQKAWGTDDFIDLFVAPFVIEDPRGFAQAVGARAATSILLGEAQKGGAGGTGLEPGDTPLTDMPTVVTVEDPVTLIDLADIEGPKPSGPYRVTVAWDRVQTSKITVLAGDVRQAGESEGMVGAFVACNSLMRMFQQAGRAPNGYTVAVEVGPFE